MASFTDTARQIKGRVIVSSNGSTLYTLTGEDYIKDFVIDRTCAESKIAGVSVSGQITLTLIDENKALVISKGDLLNTQIGYEDTTPQYQATGLFIVDSIDYNETGYTWTITGYDYVNLLGQHNYGELTITYPTTLGNLLSAALSFCGIGISYANTPTASLRDLSITTNPFDDSTTLRSVVDQCLEVLGAVGYIYGSSSTFKVITISANYTLTAYQVPKAMLFDFTSGDSITIGAVKKQSELGDNISIGSGTPYIINENDILNAQTDAVISTIITTLYNRMNGAVATNFTLKWRGVPNITPDYGYYLSIQKKDDTYGNYRPYSNKLTFNGGFKMESSASLTEEEVGNTNDVSIGDKLKSTYARVDKANQTITLVAGDVASLELSVDGLTARVGTTETDIATLELTTEGLTTKVNSVETTANGAATTATEAKQTAEGFSQRITTAEGDISSIEHTMDGVIYENAQGTTVINGSNITTGSINASIIGAGTIDADRIDVETLNVNGKTIGGSSNVLSAQYGDTIYLITTSDSITYTTTITPRQVSYQTTGANPVSKSWYDIISGSGGSGTFG